MQPVHSLVSKVVYAANGQFVDTTICNGKILMKNGKIEEMEEVIVKVREVVKRLFG